MHIGNAPMFPPAERDPDEQTTKNDRKMKAHKLKLNVKYFDDVLYDVKKFEIRRNDREYCLGDILILQEWDGTKYTGREILAIVTYIIDLEEIGLKGWVAMGIG